MGFSYISFMFDLLFGLFSRCYCIRGGGFLLFVVYVRVCIDFLFIIVFGLFIVNRVGCIDKRIKWIYIYMISLLLYVRIEL